MQKYNHLSDQELVRLYLAGDNPAFTTLVYRHKDRIFTTIVLLVRDKALAEDFFQEVFIKIINALKSGQYTDNNRFCPWVVRIAHNFCISHFRKAETRHNVVTRFNEAIGDSLHYMDFSPEQRLITGERYREIEDMLDRLPAAQREALILRYYAGLNYREMAQTVGISINTALGRVRYALMNLRRQMAASETVMC
ncbi:RNA polymerase sigma-70 factor, ECF subfamily [Chitinophaga jiangningensis]|uniref:RNA polymerase sigma-70 factor, ECF subfamily n=1 Tax=Chitinophaga jiangningensis TaxID=1419482 RepID=A0A1M7N2B8_9BACT|nr:sigma-70 family RNA polymerase sigma factor [Chitinophaga jiangningensis]SHM97705.1 RNA polymerase sigma-70 factor, ECF subfamily [Chitinophaga jiangningensis]